MKREDRRRVCEGFQEIETDLAFEVLEAWREKRDEDFVGALDNLKTLREVARDICR